MVISSNTITVNCYALTFSSNTTRVAVGDSVNFNLSVTPAYNGTAKIYESIGSSTIIRDMSGSNGKYYATLNFNTKGQYSISSSILNESSNNILIDVIASKAKGTIVLSANNYSPFEGSNVYFTATLNNISGIVKLYENGTYIKNMSVSGGKATASVYFKNEGSYTMSATVNGYSSPNIDINVIHRNIKRTFDYLN